MRAKQTGSCYYNTVPAGPLNFIPSLMEKSFLTDQLHCRIFPLASEAKIPPKQRSAKRLKAVLSPFKKSA